MFLSKPCGPASAPAQEEKWGLTLDKAPIV